MRNSWTSSDPTLVDILAEFVCCAHFLEFYVKMKYQYLRRLRHGIISRSPLAASRRRMWRYFIKCREISFFDVELAYSHYVRQVYSVDGLDQELTDSVSNTLKRNVQVILTFWGWNPVQWQETTWLVCQSVSLAGFAELRKLNDTNGT